MKRDNSTLKTYFETGKYPTQTQFADLIDSFLNIEENDAVTGITDNGDGTYTFQLLSGPVTIDVQSLPNDIPIANIVGLQTALDAKLSITGGTLTGDLIMESKILANQTVNNISPTTNGDKILFIGSDSVGTPAVADWNLINIRTIDNNSLYHNENRVWTAGNDGSGSGLDADLLDGQQGSYFLNTSSNIQIKSARLILQDTGGGIPLIVQGLGVVGDNSAINHILARDSTGANLWYIGMASSGNNDIIINNYSGGAYIKIKDGGEESGLEYYTGSSTRTVWHSGNDGAGSGLDADTLRGVHWGNINTDVNIGGILNLVASTTESRALQIGQGRTGNGFSIIDLVGDVTYTDYGFRMLRNNTGANANSDIRHKGTGTLRFFCEEAGAMTFATNNTTRFTIASGGTATFSSTVTATNFILSSDKRLKTKIKPIKELFSKVEWISFETKESPLQKRYGVVAQELEKHHPEFIRTDENGMKSVAYIDLLVVKMAEKDKQMDDYNREVKEKDKEIKNLNNRLDKMEALLQNLIATK